VPLERIVDNPFQTRSDYGDVAELAESLLKLKASRPETSGLLQTPLARITHDGQGLDPSVYGGALACLDDEEMAVVELAAGHRRLRAFAQLAAAGHIEYGALPVDICLLDDEEMADVAWEENAKRKDLSPIEEAEAMQRAMTRFGWMQAEVGQRWGLSQSAVANKLRLLGLPGDAQAAIRAGQLSERHGRALLTAAAKSQRIYHAVAAQVIPRPVAGDEAAGRARQALAQGNYRPVTLWHDRQTVVCQACGASQPVGGADGESVYVALTGNADEGGYERVYLCEVCYRVATDWTPPSAAETDKLVEQITYRQVIGLDRNHFPLDVEIVASSPGPIVSPRCAGCPARQERNGRTECLDRVCYEAKRRLWEARQADELYTRLRERYPDAADFVVADDFRGYDLRANDQVDQAMVRDSHCGPHCERLSFGRVYTDIYLRPFDDLPFAYRCNNTNSHLACQRRYLAGQRSQAEMDAEKQLKNSVAANRQAANALLRRARLSISQALLDGHASVWIKLAWKLGGREQKSLDAALASVAGAVIGWDLECHSDWSREETPARFEEEIERILADLGVALLSGLEDIQRQLARIADFILAEVGQPRLDLTPEQVRGNRENLRKLQVELRAMIADGRATADEAATLGAEIEYLQRTLDISREIMRRDDDE